MYRMMDRREIVPVNAGDVVVSQESGRRITLQSHIGRGAFAEVWLGSDARTGKQRAVKIVNRGKEEQSMTEAENFSRAVDQAGYFHIPEFHEASQGSVEGSTEPYFYMIVMQFINGPTLEHGVRQCDPRLEHRRALPPSDVAWVVLQDTLVALQRLHDVGIIHADVKGANILVSREGDCYLCDFGVTVFIDDFEVGQPMPKVGTPFYMAPEILKSDYDGHCEYDAKVDVWSLGVLGYELAFGLPHVAEFFAKIRIHNPQKAAVFEYLMTRPSPEIPQGDRCPGYYGFLVESLDVDPLERLSSKELSLKYTTDNSLSRSGLARWVAAGLQ